MNEDKPIDVKMAWSIYDNTNGDRWESACEEEMEDIHPEYLMKVLEKNAMHLLTHMFPKDKFHISITVEDDDQS